MYSHFSHYVCNDKRNWNGRKRDREWEEWKEAKVGIEFSSSFGRNVTSSCFWTRKRWDGWKRGKQRVQHQNLSYFLQRREPSNLSNNTISRRTGQQSCLPWSREELRDEKNGIHTQKTQNALTLKSKGMVNQWKHFEPLVFASSAATSVLLAVLHPYDFVVEIDRWERRKYVEMGKEKKWEVWRRIWSRFQVAR